MNRPEFDLRPAAASDAEAIARIWHAGYRDGHAGHVPAEIWAYRRLADFEERVPDLVALTTVAEHDGAIVGFVMVMDDEIYQLYVEGAARGSGVAAALLGHGEERIARHHRVGWLAVVAGNARARRFYERSGWTDVAQVAQPSYAGSATIMVPARRYEKEFAGPQ